MKTALLFQLLLAGAGIPLQESELVLEHWPVAARGPHAAALAIQDGRWISVDLSDLKVDVNIHSARLAVSRKLLDGTMDDSIVNVEIHAGEKTGGKPLELLPPRYDSFEVTGIIRHWIRDPAADRRFLVKACPGWQPEKTYLEICYHGDPTDLPPAVKGLKVLHRAGQTFIVWQEIEQRVPRDEISWGELKSLLADLDRPRRVRYRLYRHASPITGATIGQSEFLGEVPPLSAYNSRGRSVDELIRLVRKRAIDDLELSRKLARGNYFSSYHPDMPEMDEVPIDRFAIEDGKPLPFGSGLFVHHPKRAEPAFYAVVSSIDGVANLRDFSGANSLKAPVVESVGPGRPVRQRAARVTVFFDFPGERYRYVQWASPPLSHLPGMYFNWGVFIPRDWDSSRKHRLAVFFHDSRQRYLKPPWPHRQDTVLLSPHDAPFRSYGYGYHEALGTLRSFQDGRVHPYLARRVDAMIAWAVKEFGADPGRISCGGHGTWGGTAALQYGLRRPGKIAYVVADQAPDPDPRQTPPEYCHYGRPGEKPRRTHRAPMEAVWGRAAWRIETESGEPIWEELDLPGLVRRELVTTRPYISLGAGSLHVTWKQETDLMKAFLETGNGFMANFFWGGSDAIPLPCEPFEPRCDGPILGCRPGSPLFPKFIDSQFKTGKRGYSGGSRLNTIPRWMEDGIVDEPGRLELTIYAERKVTYARTVKKETTIRNARKFRPRPGEMVRWTRSELKNKRKKTGGEVRVREGGLIAIPDLEFGAPARLVLERAGREK